VGRKIYRIEKKTPLPFRGTAYAAKGHEAKDKQKTLVELKRPHHVHVEVALLKKKTMIREQRVGVGAGFAGGFANERERP